MSPPNNARRRSPSRAPAEARSIKAPATITLEAAASDSDGTVQHVVVLCERHADRRGHGESVRRRPGAGVPAGTYTLTAVATDDLVRHDDVRAGHTSRLRKRAADRDATDACGGATFTSPAMVTVGGDRERQRRHRSSRSRSTRTASRSGPPTATPVQRHLGPADWGPTRSRRSPRTTRARRPTSAPVHVTVNPIPGRTNIALATSGASALASSTYTRQLPAHAGAINGDRKGAAGAPAAAGSTARPTRRPDWLEVDFNGLKLIEEVDVFSMQDNYRRRSIRRRR